MSSSSVSLIGGVGGNEQPHARRPPPALVVATGGEPDLSGVCFNESDKVVVRNIIYTLWALNKPSSSGSGNSGFSGCCYMVCVFFILVFPFSSSFFYFSKTHC